jgi:hypothetical protein
MIAIIVHKLPVATVSNSKPATPMPQLRLKEKSLVLLDLEKKPEANAPGFVLNQFSITAECGSE